MSRFRRTAAVSVAAFAAVVGLAAGCTVPVPGRDDAAAQSPQPTPPASVAYSFSEGATDVAPTAVRIDVSAGTISSVKLFPSMIADGKVVPVANTSEIAAPDTPATSTALPPHATAPATPGLPGTVSPDKRQWAPDAPLEYGQHYTVEVVSANVDGTEQRESRSFTVVTPEKTTEATLMSSGGNAIESNREYGVGQVISVRFDTAPENRAEALKYMHVTTEPALEGGWYWITPYQADWRPKDYYPTGTKVSVDIDVAGRDLGDGQFATGTREQANFTIGTKRVAVIDDNDKTLRLYENDQLIHEMPASMGRGGYETHGGVSMHYWTQPGTYTVLDKTSSIIMDSTTYGLPLSAGGYRTPISNAVRISNDGIYLHQLGNTWAQGVQNVSHGCINLSPSNAPIYFDWAVSGDVVEVRNTGGPELQPWQNGSWSVPWSEWQTGEADF